MVPTRSSSPRDAERATNPGASSAPDTSPGGADYHLIHGFLVRKAEKEHGTGQRIEGFREKGAKVVIVDESAPPAPPRCKPSKPPANLDLK